MAAKRPRTQQRIDERAARKLVRDKERLAALVVGGSPERPIEVETTSVIELRTEAMPCPQCDGPYRIRDHAAVGAGLRRIDVTCRQCGTPRSLWFRIVTHDPN